MTAAAATETEDYIAIRRLQSAYADTVTRQAWHELDDQFRRDATLVLGSGERAMVVEGPAAIGALIEGNVAHLRHLIFVVLNTHVVIDGDTARSRSTIWEMHLARDTGQRSDLFGVYHDWLQRADGRWWFGERHWHRLARSGAAMEGWDFPAELDGWLV